MVTLMRALFDLVADDPAPDIITLSLTLLDDGAVNEEGGAVFIAADDVSAELAVLELKALDNSLGVVERCGQLLNV